MSKKNKLRDTYFATKKLAANYHENYILNRVKGVGFEEVVSLLGEPVDESEVDELAKQVFRMINCRLETLHDAMKICEPSFRKNREARNPFADFEDEDFSF